MLTRLTIQDVVLIDKLTLVLGQGLNVFTGETGAGKSILLDALGLTLGARSEAGLIRAGAKQAVVTAEFSLPLPPTLTHLLDAQGLTPDEDLILRRVIGKDGKSRAFVNDQPISIGLLRQIGEELMEIHGQFDTHGLLNPATHKAMLDTFGGLDSLVAETVAAYAAWQDARAALDNADTAFARAEAEQEFLSAAVAELNELAPEKDEIDKLTAARTQLQHASKIIEALQQAEQALGGDRGAEQNLALAAKGLARVADKAVLLPPLLATLDRLTAEVADATHQVTRAMDSIEAEPDALQKIEERLFSLRALARKHHVTPEELPELAATLTERLALLTDQGDRRRALTAAVTTTRAAYSAKADKLSAARQAAATRLAHSITQELPPLKLERARFEVDVAALPEAQWQAEGKDRVTFLAATNPGSAAGPLHKVASGGELARFTLALKVVLKAGAPISVLVFDEVDTGIGGATASAVGERLARLAQDIQVLVVTHSPQVAARGHHHLQVAKQVQGTHTLTSVTRLDAAARIEEIARMLAGSQTTEAAREAARCLLDDSTAAAKPKNAKTKSTKARA